MTQRFDMLTTSMSIVNDSLCLQGKQFEAFENWIKQHFRKHLHFMEKYSPVHITTSSSARGEIKPHSYPSAPLNFACVNWYFLGMIFVLVSTTKCFPTSLFCYILLAKWELTNLIFVSDEVICIHYPITVSILLIWKSKERHNLAFID